MNESNDLMRWNRAGLSALDYIDGNAATYLEDLRLALRTQFAGDDDVLSWLGEAVTDKTQKDWEQRLLAQYRSERRDYSWELLRTYARAVHVLAQTADAYGNERYIRTATQWDNVRRLVNMLDYHPAPPASAETHIALFAKARDAAIGTVNKGLAVKNQPTDGSAPLTFETLEDIDVDYRLNQLRAVDYNRSNDSLTVPAENGSFDFYIDGADDDGMPEDVSVGDRGLVSSLSESVAVSVKAIGDDYISLTVIEDSYTGDIWAISDIRLHLAPSWNNAPKLNGPHVVEVDKANGAVAAGDVLVYKVGSTWYPRKVIAVEGTRVQLSSSVSGTATLYRTLAVKLQDYNSIYQRFVVPLEREADTIWDQNLSAVAPQYEYVVDADGDTTSEHLLAYVWDSDAAAVHYLPKDTPAAFTVVDSNPAKLQFEGKAGDLTSDDWLLLQNDEEEWFSYSVAEIDESDGGYIVDTVDSLASGVWQLALGHFPDTYAYYGYDENDEPAYHDATETNCQLTLLLDEVPELLTTGRKLWVVGPEDCELVSVGDVLGYDSSAGTVTVSVKPSLSGLDLPKYATGVYGNVVKTGHGETRALNVLGNGNRITKNQSFTYSKTGIAFEQDADFDSGVRASIDLLVDGRRWTQTDNLRNAGATDTSYQTELNEDGELVIIFGDGIRGQRLPTGTNNILIQARFGHGAEGNLDAESLDKLKQPHYLVEEVYQPANATGGGDLETTESLRELAPASVLTLDRAVSISDFGYIAQRHSSVWQARSFALPDTPGATDRVEVVLVPVGGGELGELGDTMTDYLLNHTRPGVQVIVSRYRAILLFLDITIRVDTTAYDGDTVVQRVREALYEGFSLLNARLGASLYRSQVYQMIEAVEGVENVDVLINPFGFYDEDGVPIEPGDVYIADDSSVRRITPTDSQLIYLNSDVLAPVIAWEVADV